MITRSVWISSELKALKDDCEHFQCFPPGHFYLSKNATFQLWYNPPWYTEAVPNAPYDPIILRHAFEKAVTKRLMTDVPFGVLLSGGLDSSLVASVAARYLARTKVARQWATNFIPFASGSPDLKAGKEVADYLGTIHHEFTFTVQDGIDAIEDVIYHTETYDVTPIRASTPMFLLSRKIKSLGVQDGIDAIEDVIYLWWIPLLSQSSQQGRIKALHQYDCLRANKATSAWGLEARVPFLDKKFIDCAMSIDPEWKMIKPDQEHIEKWVLRNAFDDEENPYLPNHILYRQKEQFSDGVGYSWIDGLKAHAEQQVSDKMMQNAANIFPHNTPNTKEAYYYRMIFEKFFPQNSAVLTVPGGPSVACSTAKAVEWDATWSNNLDPSGRATLGVHNSCYNRHPQSQIGTQANKVIDTIPLAVQPPQLTIHT
ncbi:hypothetical protein V2J09_006978 [Rumex salicifolius]